MYLFFKKIYISFIQFRFKRLERETKALRENFEREKDSANRFRNEANQLREIRKKDKEILEVNNDDNNVIVIVYILIIHIYRVQRVIRGE